MLLNKGYYFIFSRHFIFIFITLKIRVQKY